MSWTQQVWHMFVKDVREQRVLLMIYAGCLILGSAQGAGVFAYDLGRNGIGGLILQLLPIVIAATITVRDAPLREGAYWSVLPYERFVVWAAKCLLLVLLVILLVLSLLPPLLSVRAGLGETVRFTLAAGLSLLTFTLGMGLIASVWRTHRINVAVGIVVVVALAAFPLAVAASDVGIVLETPEWLVPLLLSAGFGVLALHYHRRRAAWAVRAGTLLLGLVLLALPVMQRSAAPEAHGIDAARVAGAVPEFSMGPFRSTPSTGAPESGLSELVALSSAHSLQGNLMTANIRFADSLLLDGESPAVRGEFLPLLLHDDSAGVVAAKLSQVRYRIYEPPLPLAAGIRVLGIAGSTGYRASGWISASYSSSQRFSELQATPLRMEGRIELRKPRLLVEIPLLLRESSATAGRRFTLAQTSDSARIAFDLSITSAPRHNTRPSDRGMPAGQYSFVLVNAARHEAIRLHAVQRSESAFGWMLVPFVVTESSLRLVPEVDAFGGADEVLAVLTEPWLRDSHLMVFEWVLVGTTPVSATSLVGSKE